MVNVLIQQNSNNSGDLYFDEIDQQFHRYPDGDVATHEEIRYYFQNMISLNGFISKDIIRKMVKEIKIDIERNKRKKIEHTIDENSDVFASSLILYDPEIVKTRLENALWNVFPVDHIEERIRINYKDEDI